MAGGGGGEVVVPVSPRARQPRGGGRRRHKAAACLRLPLDIIVEEIAARSDAATLVRCAATCRDARRRIAGDPDLRRRLRLPDTGRFLLPLLRGHLVGIETFDADLHEKTTDVYLADAAARLVKATLLESETLREAFPMDARGGLVLACATSTACTWLWEDQLVVCNPATGRHFPLPSTPSLPRHLSLGIAEQFVLLVGEGSDAAGAVGRPFQVLMVKLMLSEHHRSDRRLLVHTFSSEDGGAWSPLTEIPAPNLHGSARWTSRLHDRPVVTGGDAVHWLLLTDAGSYVLTLDARAARVRETALPAIFPRDGKRHSCRQRYRYQYLMAAASAGGKNPVVLVADKDKISSWEQSEKTKTWRPRVVMVTTAIPLANQVPHLVCFAEKSGIVLLHVDGCRLLWLDMHSKKIVRSFDSTSYSGVYCPYEMDSSSWVPTFSKAGTF